VREPDDTPVEFGVDPQQRQPTAPAGADDLDSAEDDVPEEDADDRDGAAGADEAPDAEKSLPSVWNKRSVLLIGLAVVIMLCSGAFGVGYVLYNRAAEPDRSTPGVAVGRYLNAALEQRDDAAAKIFTCGDSADLGAVDALLSQIKAQEAKFGVRNTVKWGDFAVNTHGGDATVGATLRIQTSEVNGQTSESMQQWSFVTRKRSSWLVCQASRVS
jgi:hypothetical protein